MKLIGSSTSPFVRRIRLLLGGSDYEFASLDIYGADRDELRRNNPALKVPMLIDDAHSIYDSRVIARYLSQKMGFAALSWEQENQLTLIDAVNGSMVTIALSKKSGLATDSDIMFYGLQHERIERSIDALSDMAAAGAFDDWHYPSICLYCLIDWAEMRELFDFSDHAPLLELKDRFKDKPMVGETDPRQAL
ncbi:glutathione S-transferase [Salinisphaera shabanensis T35B1]|uniref:glutathione S-transferase family protein n=1 Tax=Salinisphaera shabanensis TaxID=180542 RepID=UPI00333FD970